MTKAKKLLITLPALSSCLCTIMGCKEDKPLDKENIVFNDENIVTRANSFEGLGVEWGTPIHLDFKSPLIHFLQRLRDEAHRFAVGSHRIKREKSFLHDSLRDIEGIGEKRRKELMLHFGSVRAVKGASLQQLELVPGFSKKIAKKVYTFFHNESIIKNN